MTTWLMALPATQRALIVRAGGFACQAKHAADAEPPIAKARAGKEAKKLRQIDPDGVLPEDVRRRLLAFAIHEEMALRAAQSAAARRERAQARAGLPSACAWGRQLRAGTDSTICRRHRREVDREQWRRWQSTAPQPA